MAWNEPLPEWNETGHEPPTSKKDEGWQPEEKPPAGWFNWLFNRIYKCLEEVREAVDEAPSSEDLDNHITDTDNPHAVAKSDVGLDNVVNERQTVAKEGGKNIWVQSAEPTAEATGDLWIETE